MGEQMELRCRCGEVRGVATDLSVVDARSEYATHEVHGAVVIGHGVCDV